MDTHEIGLIVMTIASVALAVLTAWQAVPVKGWLNGILLGYFSAARSG